MRVWQVLAFYVKFLVVTLPLCKLIYAMFAMFKASVTFVSAIVVSAGNLVLYSHSHLCSYYLLIRYIIVPVPEI